MFLGEVSNKRMSVDGCLAVILDFYSTSTNTHSFSTMGGGINVLGLGHYCRAQKVHELFVCLGICLKFRRTRVS
jgi:hypothetical protein